MSTNKQKPENIFDFSCGAAGFNFEKMPWERRLEVLAGQKLKSETLEVGDTVKIVAVDRRVWVSPDMDNKLGTVGVIETVATNAYYLKYVVSGWHYTSKCLKLVKKG